MYIYICVCMCVYILTHLYTYTVKFYKTLFDFCHLPNINYIYHFQYFCSHPFKNLQSPTIKNLNAAHKLSSIWLFLPHLSLKITNCFSHNNSLPILRLWFSNFNIPKNHVNLFKSDSHMISLEIYIGTCQLQLRNLIMKPSN